MRNPVNNFFTPNEQKILLILCIILLLGIGLNAFGWKAPKGDSGQNATQKLMQATQKDKEIKIDIRTAEKDELILLPGIGEKRAADIIKLRKQTPFTRTSDIMLVKGIGERTYAKLLPMLLIFGEDAQADSSRVNTLPKDKEEPGIAIHSRPGKTPRGEDTSIVNLNTATLEELCTLSGIGVVKAKAIIDYRNDQGAFEKIEDLMNVKGIGEKTFSKNRHRLSI